MKRIPLTKGHYSVVDEDSYEDLMQWKWHYSNGYAKRTEGGRKSKIVIAMHRYLNKTPNGFETDHINGDRLDNRKSNLRTVTRKKNRLNLPKYKTNKSGFKGVYWFKPTAKWAAAISTHNKRIYLGCFRDKLEAAKAYNAASLKYHGSFSRQMIGGTE